jgi:hypothetical protein
MEQDDLMSLAGDTMINSQADTQADSKAIS